ncbi:MAG: hypothetical protein E6L07_12450 [Verrucomicrobia bacterium]|nr:MAG: hypothetical protein E6L07_12450 [Verrucomicrobiota bacterium]
MTNAAQAWNRSSRPTRPCSLRREQKRAPVMRLLTQLLPLLNPLFFNNLVVVLDGFFVHRSRTLEGKDGNPLNEFRMICTSLLQNHGVMCPDKTNNKTIKYSPEKSVVKLKIGDEIKLTESAFVLLSRAFFAEIETKFS